MPVRQNVGELDRRRGLRAGHQRPDPVTSPWDRDEMDALLVDSDEIELTPDPPWMWMAPVRLSVMAMPGHRIKADGKFTIGDTEIAV